MNISPATPMTAAQSVPVTQVGTVVLASTLGGGPFSGVEDRVLARTVQQVPGPLADALSAARDLARTSSHDGFSSAAFGVSAVADGTFAIQELLVDRTRTGDIRPLSIDRTDYYGGSGPRITRSDEALQAIVDMKGAHVFEGHSLTVDPWAGSFDLS